MEDNLMPPIDPVEETMRSMVDKVSYEVLAGKFKEAEQQKESK
jgi:hypothetical protein